MKKVVPVLTQRIVVESKPIKVLFDRKEFICDVRIPSSIWIFDSDFALFMLLFLHYWKWRKSQLCYSKEVESCCWFSFMQAYYLIKLEQDTPFVGRLPFLYFTDNNKKWLPKSGWSKPWAPQQTLSLQRIVIQCLKDFRHFKMTFS